MNKAVPALNDPMGELASIDRAIVDSGVRSLSPDTLNPTPLTELVPSVAADGIALLAKFAFSASRAQLANFPGNIFWDWDYLISSVWRDATDSADPHAYLTKVSGLFSDLMRLYGRHSTIRFRYVHDFVYGFDWARWMMRTKPDVDHQPFGLAFLNHSKTRAYELLALIAKNDERYPTLPSDKPRNPFSFVRDPEQERILYSDLAARDLIPVRAWDRDAVPVWEKDFDAHRQARAEALGFIKR